MPDIEPIVQRIVLKDDAAESAKSEAAITRVRTSLRGLAQDTASASAPASSAAVQFKNIAQAAAALNLSKSQVAQLTGETTQLAAATTQAAAAEEKLAAASVKASSGGGGLANARQIAGAAGGLASTVGGGQAVSALSSVLGLTAALGPMGIALGIGTVAIKAVTDAETQRAEAAKKSADILSEIYGGAVDQTTEALTQQISQLSRQRAGLQQAREVLTGMQETADANFGFVNISGEAVKLSDVLDQNQQAIDAVSEKLLIHNAQLETAVVRENDAAAASEAFAQALDEATKKTTQAQLSAAQRAVEIQQMTADEREKEIASIAEEITVLQNYIATHALTEEAYTSLSDQLDTLTARTDELSAVTITYADVLAQEQAQKERVTEQSDNYLDAITREVEARDKITDLYTQIATARSDAEASIRDVLQGSADRRAEIEADGAQQREQIASDSATRIAQIERRAAYSESVAKANLDAVAFAQAKKQAELQRRDQEDADKKAVTRLESNLQKQESAVQSSQDKQVSSILSAEQRKISTLQQSVATQQAIVQNARYAQEQIAMYGSGNLVTIHTQMWQNVNQIAVTWATNTLNTIRNILGSVANINASAQGYNYSAGQFPASFTGTPFASGSQVQQIATQAARNYMYDMLRSGRWITAT